MKSYILGDDIKYVYMVHVDLMQRVICIFFCDILIVFRKVFFIIVSQKKFFVQEDNDKCCYNCLH